MNLWIGWLSWFHELNPAGCFGARKAGLIHSKKPTNETNNPQMNGTELIFISFFLAANSNTEFISHSFIVFLVCWIAFAVNFHSLISGSIQSSFNPINHQSNFINWLNVFSHLIQLMFDWWIGLNWMPEIQKLNVVAELNKWINLAGLMNLI